MMVVVVAGGGYFLLCRDSGPGAADNGGARRRSPDEEASPFFAEDRLRPPHCPGLLLALPPLLPTSSDSLFGASSTVGFSSSSLT